LDVCFATRSLQRQCNKEAALVAKWGPRGAASLSRALQELAALDHLADVAALPHVRLTGDTLGRMALGSSDGSQITLEARNDGAAPGVGLGEIRAVVVTGVAVIGPRGGDPSNG
jgi:hypothetical protein